MTTEQWVNELNEYKKPKGKEEIQELSFAWFKMKKWPIMADEAAGYIVKLSDKASYLIYYNRLDVSLGKQSSGSFRNIKTCKQINELLISNGMEPIDFNMYIRLKELRKKLL